MSATTSADAGPSSVPQSTFVQPSDASSGLTINLHPLPILNISEHFNRARLSRPSPKKLIGALLGSQSNREVSIVNSFELTFLTQAAPEDDNMEGSSTPTDAIRPFTIIDVDFLATRKEQFKQVFPTLDVIGWYTIGSSPSVGDVQLHQQLITCIDTPLMILFDPTSLDTQDIPIKVFEAALAEGGKESEADGRFVELEYGIETGEAERIAVDGVSKGGSGADGEDALVGNLTTQRNAIFMLYERIQILLSYVSAVMSGAAKPDHVTLRQIAAVVSTLPTMNAEEFKAELMTEYTDVQLTAYLTSITKQLSALAEYTDKHNILHPAVGEEFGPGAQGQKEARVNKGFNLGSFAGFGGGKRRG